MEHYYILAQNKNENLKEYINPYNIHYEHQNQTFWEPEYENFTYDVEIQDEFWNNILIIECWDNNQDYLVCVNKKWYIIKEIEELDGILDSFEYELCYEILEEAYESNQEIHRAVNEWAKEVAEEKAIEFLEEKDYGDY